MSRKPWPIIFLSLIFLAIPLVNLIVTFFILKTNYSFLDYLYSLVTISSNYMPLFDMMIPSLISGIAIYCVRKWSYPVFLVCMSWITLKMILSTKLSFDNVDIIFTFLIPMAANIFFVSYILLPEVRAAYFDPRLRWWETKSRYLITNDLKIKINEELLDAKISNISEGGLFAEIPKSVEPQAEVTLSFEMFAQQITLAAKIVYSTPNGQSHGLQFINISKEQKKILKIIIGKLVEGKYQVSRPVPIWTEDLASWFKKLIKTGKGFVPEIPKR